MEPSVEKHENQLYDVEEDTLGYEGGGDNQLLVTKVYSCGNE